MVERRGVDSQVEEIADAFSVAVAGELGENGSGFGEEVHVFDGHVLECGLVVPGAGSDERIVRVFDVEDGFYEGASESALHEEVQDVASASARGHVNCGSAFAVFEGGVGSVVEKEPDDFEAVIAQDRVLERGVLPVSGVVGVGSVGEEVADAFKVMPVGFAEEEGG